MRKHTISFKHAASGFQTACRTQPNFRVHLVATLLVILISYYLSLSSIEWVIIIITISWVLLAELINTALESIVDLITKEYAVEAKIAKDVSAAAVLLSAIAAVIIAILILVPKLLTHFAGI
jgi:diacylglycerol kinase